ncbi:MAG: hypothetical protein E6861_07665 [Stenotrophomonas maltophilia]|nr:hypothetical protein [Stenotrophomonas maltophilia]
MARYESCESKASASHELARQMKERDDEVRRRDQAVLIALIYAEVLSAAISYADLLEHLVTGNSLEWAVESEVNLDKLERLAAGPGLVRSKKEIGRLNLLPAEICEQLAMGLALTDLCAENVRLLRQANDRDGQEEQFEVLCNSVQGAAKAFAAASARMKLLMVSNERVEAHVDTPHA